MTAPAPDLLRLLDNFARVEAERPLPCDSYSQCIAQPVPPRETELLAEIAAMRHLIELLLDADRAELTAEMLVLPPRGAVVIDTEALLAILVDSEALLAILVGLG